PARQTHACAERVLYRLFAAGSADDRDAGRRQVLSRTAAGRVRHRGARAQHKRPALGLRQDPHPPLDRVSRHRRGGGPGGGGGERLADLRVAFTGTNPQPVLLVGTVALAGGPLDARVFKGLDELVRDQIMSMKTTFTPGHYRRRVAGVLARRLVTKLFAG